MLALSLGGGLGLLFGSQTGVFGCVAGSAALVLMATLALAFRQNLDLLEWLTDVSQASVAYDLLLMGGFVIRGIPVGRKI